MNVAAINAYRSVQSMPLIRPTEAASAPAGASFGDVLSKAVGNLDGLQQKADSAMLKLASGQPIEMHQAMMAMEEASLGMQFALQVRTKVIEAYQEVMRMQV